MSLPRFSWYWAIFLMCFCYFSYHLIQGQRGVLALFRYQQELSSSEKIRDQLKEEKEALENRVTKLRPEGLSLDLLEEVAKNNLNVRRPDEVVLVEKKKELE